MITIQEYYNSVNEGFLKTHMPLFKESLSYRIDENEKAIQGSSKLIELLDLVYDKYDFNLHKQIKPNLQQFYLYQLQICGKTDSHRLDVALVFVLFCCLADKFLDSPRFSEEEKEYICQKLDTKHLLSDIPYGSEHFQEMNELLNYLRAFMVKHSDFPRFQVLIEDIQDAFASEMYMSKAHLPMSEKSTKKDLYLLTDKSIKFEKSAFLLSVLGDITPDADTIADSIAKIFWLADDLCDFVEDVQCKRKNSLLYLYTSETEKLSLTERVEQTYRNLSSIYTLLDEEIERLSMVATPQLYHFIITQVWDWFSDVRKKAENQT